MVILGLIKGLYGTIVSGVYENLFYPLYALNYISIVFPARIWALVNLNDNSWGTSTRKIGTIDDVSMDIVMLILWNVNLIGGFAYSLWRNRAASTIEWILLGVPLGFLTLGIIMMKIYITFRKVVTSKKKD